MRRRGQRDMAFPGQKPRCRVQPDPAGAGDIHLDPGMQIGKIDLGPRGAIEGFHIRRKLDQIARHEPRGKAQMPQHLQKFVIEELEVGELSVFVKEGLLGLADTAQLRSEEALTTVRNPLVTGAVPELPSGPDTSESSPAQPGRHRDQQGADVGQKLASFHRGNQRRAP